MENLKKLPFDKYSFDITKYDPKVDYSGRSFNHWTLIKKSLKTGIYDVQCDCGFLCKKKITDLFASRSTQCLRCRIKERRANGKGVMFEII